jgi:S-formylglutathione hydrolase FrmB
MALGKPTTVVGCAAVALATFAISAPIASGADPDGARVVAEQRLGANRVELTIQTPAFAAPTRVQVVFPAGYDAQSARRWPVTYYLHGAQGDEKRFNEWYGDLIRNFPSIVVAPQGGTIGFYSDWYNGGAGGPPMYETYDVDQLVTLIDARFRTVAERAGRAVIGESMGGYGVMTYAARHPDLFAAAASLSGAVDSNYAPAIALISAGPPLQGGQPDAIYGSRISQEVRWHGHNPTDVADNLRDVDLQVRTAEGVPDPSIETPGEGTASDCALERGIFQMTTDFHERLLALGIPHVWKDYGAGCHTIPNFRREFTDALPGLERVLAHPRPDPATFSYRSIEPHFSVWDWRIDAEPARALEFLELRNAGRGGVTLVGSGKTSVTTPAFFRGLRAVDVGAPNATKVVAPDRDGRLRFTVDLGRAHPNQQDTDASRAAGDGTPGYFIRRSVSFAPHARLVLRKLRIRHASASACVRSVGTVVRRVRISLSDNRARQLARSRRLTVGGATRCVRLAGARRLRRGRYVVRAKGTDVFGHDVAARRRFRLGR